MRDPARIVRRRAALTAVAVAGAGVLAIAGAAAAHIDFESSDPADGSMARGPVEEITIRFTNAAEPSGDGFVVLVPGLGEREPSEVANPDVGVFVLQFDPPISPGRVGVGWTVKAPDAHPINGSFAFTVEPAATTPPPSSATSLPGSARTSLPGEATTSVPGDAMTSVPGGDRTPPSDGAPADSKDLEEFLSAAGTTPWARSVAHVGRFLALGGIMVAVGSIAFALTVLRGTLPELRMLLAWIRRAGAVVVIGTLLDGAGQVVYEAGDGVSALANPRSYSEVLSSSLGLALLLRIAGGAIVMGGARISAVHPHATRDVLASITKRVPIGAGSTRIGDHRAGYEDTHDVAWRLDRHGTVAGIGFLLLVVSHAFDGHTVTEGNRLLTGAASGLHVLAAAVWAGGVGALALIIGRRSRRGEPTHSLVMVTRYSVVATVALVAVAVLGVYLAVVILDAPSELWSTEWGRWFAVKTALVALTAGLGAHNHHIIVPALEACDADDATVSRLRRTLRNEVIALTVVTAVTALLVRAASTLS